MIHFVLCHGFGFAPCFWSRLMRYLGASRCSLIDLGYYGEHHHNLPPPTIPVVGIGHSIGLFKLQQLSLNYTMLIGFNGFVDFLGLDSVVRARRAQEFKAFKKKFRNDPEYTVRQFIGKCGGASVLRHLNFETINIQRLQEDLDLLEYSKLSTASYPIYVMNAKNDVIVPPYVLSSRENIHATMYAKGNHSLGWCRAKTMFHFIQRCLHA